MNDILVIGLGVMGSNLALNIADHGFNVAVYNRNIAVTQQLMEKHYPNIYGFLHIYDAIKSLVSPKKVMIMVKAGEPVDWVIEQCIPFLSEGDIILDGGNSFFKDTMRRQSYLSEKGIYFYGVGLSGGEYGARYGASIMPGGDQAQYHYIQPILEAISAKTEANEKCVIYIGNGGAGHYVKMVHNGIEYADMQLIAEAYLLLKYVGNLSNFEMSTIFEQWNQGKLQSYLIDITSRILRANDDFNDGELIDFIMDSAQQKGTGKWTSEQAISLGVDVSVINAALNARVNSSNLTVRTKASTVYRTSYQDVAIGKNELIAIVHDALYAAKIIAYAQGFDLLNKASKFYNWQLPLSKIATIFKAGCIIKAQLLTPIANAYANENLEHLLLDDYFVNELHHIINSLNNANIIAIRSNLAVAGLTNALSYFNQFKAIHMGANLIQAQRDYFGAHTYQRNDKDGVFHHVWE